MSNFPLRLPADIRERIESLAKDYGLSINKLVSMACEDFVRTGRLDELEKRIEALEQRVDSLEQK